MSEGRIIQLGKKSRAELKRWAEQELESQAEMQALEERRQQLQLASIKRVCKIEGVDWAKTQNRIDATYLRAADVAFLVTADRDHTLN